MRLAYKPAHMFFLLLLSGVLLPGCTETAQPEAAQSERYAETIFSNGQIYTLNPVQPWATHMAIGEGQILAVGDATTVAAFKSAQTRNEDLAGQFVMPGIIDAHAHPAWGGVTAIYYCLFAATAPPDEVRAIISDCVAQAAPEETWIQGGLWAAEFFNQYQIKDPRSWLDEISADKAVILKDDSGHNYWANSRALALLEIDEASVPPAGGIYARTDSGRLNGVLLEVFGQVGEKLPPWTPEHYAKGIEYAMANAHSYGVTGWKDASSSTPEVAAYAELDQSGSLQVHVAACLVALGDDPSLIDVAGYKQLRTQYQGNNLHTSFAKIFLDGIPTTSRTAAMVEPYVPVQEGAPDNYGPLHVPTEQLTEALVELDAADFTVKIHTAGDRSVHAALNAIAVARQRNGSTGPRHELAHAGFIMADDIGRFAELNVVADLSPHLWFPSPIVESVRTALGERGYQYWPNRDLLDAGAPLLMGSDWPSVAPDLNPWLGLEALVTRQDPLGAYTGRGWQEQALTVAEGIEIMTLGGASALRLEHRIGSLETGKLADFVVLNHNLLEVPAERISDTVVQATYFAGEQVYAAAD